MFTPCPSPPESATPVPAASRSESGTYDQLALFAERSPSAPQPLVLQLSADDAAPDWTEADVVQLHWHLLQELRHLPEPDAPIEEKIDTLNWVFTDPQKESRPFSFANCLRVVGCSPLSPTAFFGQIDADEIRAWIHAHVSRWMRSTLERYPPWVRDLLRADPAQCVRNLDRNPQWLNEQVRQRTARQDFFA